MALLQTKEGLCPYNYNIIFKPPPLSYSLRKLSLEELLLAAVVRHLSLAVTVADTPTSLALEHASFLVSPVHLQLAEATLVLSPASIQGLKLVGCGELGLKFDS